MLVRSTTSFAYTNAHGAQEVITPADLFHDDDPVVRAHPDMFVPVTANAGRARHVVEQATAAPGEFRGGFARRPR